MLVCTLLRSMPGCKENTATEPMSQRGSLRFGSPSWHQCTTGSCMHVFVQVTEFWCRNCEDCLFFFFHICPTVLCELSVTPRSCLVGFGIRSSYLLTCTYKHFTLRVTERLESAYSRGFPDLVPNEYRSVRPGCYAPPACCLKPLKLGLRKQWYWHGLKACLVLARCNSNYFNCPSKIFWHCQLSEMLLRTYCRRADSD